MAPALTPVPLDNGVATLGPENSRIVFVGVHSNPEKPDPRTGGFEKFTGKAAVSDGQLKSVELEIDMDSVFTFSPRLTGHLKNPDFFEVNEFPNAKFVTSEITADSITGDLTMHGVTKTLTVPASINVTDAGLTVSAEFQINRLDFEMDGVQDNVKAEVDMKIAIGQPTNKEDILAASSGGGGGRGGGGGGGRRGGFNPMEMFAQADANKDGKLAGDEIPERMRNFMDRIDSDGNGEISKEEMEAMAERMQNRGGGGGRGPGGGGPGSGRPERPGQ